MRINFLMGSHSSNLGSFADGNLYFTTDGKIFLDDGLNTKRISFYDDKLDKFGGYVSGSLDISGTLTVKNIKMGGNTITSDNLISGFAIIANNIKGPIFHFDGYDTTIGASVSGRVILTGGQSPCWGDSKTPLALQKELPKTETWIFTLSDNTTITKKVCVLND